MPDPKKLLLEEKLERDSRGFSHYYRDDDDVIYDVVILWRLSEFLPTFNIFASDLGQFLERDVAWSDGAPIDSDLSGEHGERIREADLSYPILVRFLYGKMLMVDGYHRVMRAHQDDESCVQARDVSTLLEEARIE